MAEQMRLHSRAMHIGTRIFTLLFGIIVGSMLVSMLLSGERDPIGFAAMGVIVISFTVLARIVWRTRPMVIVGNDLVIGRGDRQRRVDFADVLSCEHPWWVYSDRFAAPLELTLRGGDTVTFFPEFGAGDVIAHRRRGAVP